MHLEDDAPTTVAGLDRLVYGVLYRASVGSEEVVSVLVASRRRLHSHAERDIAFHMGPGVQQPCAADQADVAETKRLGGMAGRVRVEARLHAVQEGHGQTQGVAIGRGVRHGDVDRMDLVDDRLAKRGEVAAHLIGYEELIAVEIAVADGNLPLVGAEIGQP